MTFVESSKSAPHSGKYLHTAYLLSRYPAISHTFFLNEILGLRALGCHIHTASINPPDRGHAALSPLERTEQEATFYLKEGSLFRWLPHLLRITTTRPRVALRGLKAALQLEPWHLSHTMYALFYLAEAMLLGDWMRRNHLRHLHIHFSGPVASVGMITAQAWQFPYSMTVHGPDEFFDQQESALPQKIHQASFVICISEFCRSQLMRISAPSTWKKFHVVRLGVTPALAERTEVIHTGTPLRVLCTGRLVGAKGQGVLLLACAALLSRGHTLAVTLIGDGPDRAHLQALAREMKIDSAVQFAGAQTHPEVLAALQASDLFVLPSFAEGVPVALMEAMVMGVPCISTFIAGIPELIRHQQDGLLVPAGSVDQLAAAMERLILNPAERESFRRSAREQVLAHYNLPLNLKQLAETFVREAPHAVGSNTP